MESNNVLDETLTEDANIDIDASSEADVIPKYNLRKNTIKDYRKLNDVSENIDMLGTPLMNMKLMMTSIAMKFFLL